MEADLLDRIYESCFSPEVWPGVLQDLAGIAGARGASCSLLAPKS